MKKRTVVSVLACAMCLLGFFQEPNTGQKDPLKAIPNPSNFSVAPSAFVDFSSTQLSSNRPLVVESKSLRNWLRTTGSFGELVGLSDKRKIDFLFFKKADLVILEGNATPAQQELHDSMGTFPDDRVCDIVYQLLRKDHALPHIYGRYDIEKRDVLIQKLVQSIQEKEQGQVQLNANKAKGVRSQKSAD